MMCCSIEDGADDASTAEATRSDDRLRGRSAENRDGKNPTMEVSKTNMPSPSVKRNFGVHPIVLGR
jgi:hypothetical protein